MANPEHRTDTGRAVPLWAMVGAAGVLIVGGLMAAVWLSLERPAETPSADVASGGVMASRDLEYLPPSDEGYVGSEACAGCHRDIAEAFKTHPMSRSIRRVEIEPDDPVLRPEETRVVGRQRFYEVEFRDGAMWHHDRMLDAAGEPVYDQAVKMDYVVGSGRRAKAYLHQRGQLLFMSPLNLYSQSGRWDLAPGYILDDTRRFDRRVTDECLSCHAGRVAPVGRSLNAYREPAFHELSIGCENCHGPGRQHIALHSAGSVSRAADGSHAAIDSIINPSRLDPARRESVCYQCHLQAAARIPRPGRSDLDFRPGQLVEEIWTVLDSGSDVSEDGRTRSVNHVQQMRESRCYTRSEGRFGCVSCHDPHRVPAKNDEAAFYREKCAQCHADSSSRLPPERRMERDNSCIACHMPARNSSNISHVTQTDHRVLRTADRSSPNEASHQATELSVFDRADLRLKAWERDRALGLGAWKHLSKKGYPPPQALGKFLARVLEEHPDDGAVLSALGSMAGQNGLTDLSREYLERARKNLEVEEAALSGLLDLDYLSSDWTRAFECAERLVEIDPGDARVHAMRADILTQLGRREEGIAAARQALELNPTLVPVRQWLANAYRAAGREDEQREQEQILSRMHNARLPR